MGFTKLDEGIILSSVMSEPPEIFKVWIALLAICKEDGIARVASTQLSNICKLDQSITDNALSVLSAPDQASRSTNHDGRRIERVDGGFFIFNYHKYRELSYKEADAKRKYDKYHSPEKSGSLPEAFASASSPISSPVLIKGDCKGVEIKIKPEALWRTDFKIYEAEVSAAFDLLVKDSDWLSERQRYHPNLDVALSMEKAYNDFWGLEAGWMHKKKSRAATIDWKATFSNALTLKSNQVFAKRKREDDYAR